MLNLFKRRPNLTSAVTGLDRHNISAETQKRFAGFLENAQDRELFHVNPRYLAERLEMDERATLKLLLAAVHEGMMKMHWDVRCPACGSVMHRDHSLSELRREVQCAACQNVFAQRLDNEVRVTFSLHPHFRKLSAPADDAAFRNEIDAQLGAVNGQRVLLMPDFQKLFPQEKLLPDESLEVTRTALVFTDLAGSTALYAKRGDPRAYHLVRLHFEALFNVADRNGGTIVKNIGDSIMAAFETPAEALKAALAMQAGIADLNTRERLTDEEALILKVGLHSGPCLSVTLNDRPDYFGTTVNVAARVQGLSHGNDLVFTNVVRDDREAQDLLRDRTLETMTASIKGIDDELQVHRLVLTL